MTLDLLVCGLVLFFAMLGAVTGGLSQLSHIAALVAGALLAKTLGLQFGPGLAQREHWPEIAGVLIATVVVFFVLYAAVQILAKLLIQRLTSSRIFGSVDRMLGFALGGAKSAGVLYVLLSALIFFEKPFTSITHYQFDTRGSKIAALVRENNLFTRFSFPGTRGLTAVARAAANPAAAAQDPELTQLARDPKIAELLHTGELQKALQSGDGVALLRNARVLAVLTDPRLRDQLERAAQHVPEAPAPRR